MKKVIPIIVSMLLLLTTMTLNAEMITEDSQYYVTAKLKQNVEIMNELFKAEESGTADQSSTLQISLSQDKTLAKLSLNYQGESIDLELTGACSEIESDGNSGFVGVYEGYCKPIGNRDLALDEDGSLPAIADITFNDQKVFVILTLGYATEENNPDILVYGGFDSDIKALSTKNAKEEQQQAELEEALNASNAFVSEESVAINRVAADIKLKGTANIKLGTYNVGVMNIYHANEIENADQAPIYIRVNTNSANVISYVKNVLGYSDNMITVVSDQFKIEMYCTDEDFLVKKSTAEPGNAETSVSVPIYYYLNGGFEKFSYKLVTSSTKVAFSQYPSDFSGLGYNKVTWTMSKTSGWYASTFDGDGSSTNCVPATIDVEFNKTFSESSLSETMLFKATIRYKYTVTTMTDDLVCVHLLTPSVSKTTTIKLVQ